MRVDCFQGLVGGVFAQCVMGNWTKVFGGCYREPQRCYGRPRFKPGANALGWHNGFQPVPTGNTVKGEYQASLLATYSVFLL